jgi:hypothetical protein
MSLLDFNEIPELILDDGTCSHHESYKNFYSSPEFDVYFFLFYVFVFAIV